MEVGGKLVSPGVVILRAEMTLKDSAGLGGRWSSVEGLLLVGTLLEDSRSGLWKNEVDGLEGGG